MPALHLLGLEPEFIVYMLRRQDILYPSVSSARPNPINTLWVTDTLAEAQHFRMLNNGTISHHINCWRRFMNHMLFTTFPQLEYCHQNMTIFTHVAFIQMYVIFSVASILCLNWAFTSSTWSFFGHSALPFLRFRSTGLWGCKGQWGVWALELGKGRTGPRLRSFPKPTCFVLLHTGTPLAPLTKFAIWSALTWVNNTWQRLRWWITGPQLWHLTFVC